jgi:hypothetical protein
MKTGAANDIKGQRAGRGKFLEGLFMVGAECITAETQNESPP